MKEESNPYAPPRTAVAVPVASAAETGHGWRIKGDRLLVRDGAILPGICILGGDPHLPLQRSWLRLKALSVLPSGQEIEIETFESRHTYLKRCLGFFGGIALGFAGGIACSVIMMGDGSATLASISVSCLVIVLGILVGFRQCRYLPRLIRDRDGWYRVESVAPGVIARLKKLSSDSSSQQQPLGE